MTLKCMHTHAFDCASTSVHFLLFLYIFPSYTQDTHIVEAHTHAHTSTVTVVGWWYDINVQGGRQLGGTIITAETFSLLSTDGET